MNRKGDRSKKGIRKTQTGDPERKKNQYYPRCRIRPVLKKKSRAKKRGKKKGEQLKTLPTLWVRNRPLVSGLLASRRPKATKPIRVRYIVSARTKIAR